MSKAEELAKELYEHLTNVDDRETYERILSSFKRYGREVQETAAKGADKSADGELDDDAAGGAYSAAEAIRAMDLP